MAACFQFQVEQSVPALGGAIMRLRLHHAIALAAAVLIGFGVKLFFFPAPAEADASGVKSSSMNVLQMHHKGLPVQKMSDMTFVFSDD
jgi:predicted acyltransferase